MLGLSEPSVRAQNVYIVASSSITFSPSTNKVNGVSQTTMDYRTTAYYQARARGYIYLTNPASPLNVSDVTAGLGQSTATAYTQASTSPLTTYKIKTEHYLFPIYCEANCSYYLDYFNYYYSSPNCCYGAPSEFGATQTIYGCNPYPYQTCYPNIVYGWIWMGNTNSSVGTPPTVSITNPRVSGNLAGTTQSALIGADVVLTATGSPTGGTYSWTFTGAPTIVAGATNQASITVRWTQQSTFRATMTYSKSGATAISYVDVNNRVPVLTNFSATMASDHVDRDSGCSFLNGATYTLGCWAGTSDDGIVWNSTAEIPSGAYLSNPAQSGIKFVQAVSAYRKRLLNGNTQCWTNRTSEANIASGWQRDADPYNQQPHPVRYFSEGNSLAMSNLDAPGEALDLGNLYDAFYVAEYFETYVFYFTGDPGQPTFQRAIGLSGSGNPYARLAWSWGGQVSFNYFSSPSLYRRDFTTTIPGSINAGGTNAIQTMSTDVHNLSYNTCAGTTPTSNPIDGSEYFVRKLYADFLNKTPDQNDVETTFHMIKAKFGSAY